VVVVQSPPDRGQVRGGGDFLGEAQQGVNGQSQQERVRCLGRVGLTMRSVR
jgi:hypothetical protein